MVGNVRLSVIAVERAETGDFGVFVENVIDDFRAIVWFAEIIECEFPLVGGQNCAAVVHHGFQRIENR